MKYLVFVLSTLILYFNVGFSRVLRHKHSTLHMHASKTPGSNRQSGSGSSNSNAHAGLSNPMQITTDHDDEGSGDATNSLNLCVDADAVAGMSREDMLDYYQEQFQEKNNEMKSVKNEMYGNGGSGTSI